MESLVSVVIPTLLKNILVLQKLVSILNKDCSVGEIIIINNSHDKTLYFTASKVKIHTPSENLYVNKSWNLGVAMAKNDNILIINDDILCVDNFCFSVLESKILEKEDTGLVGIDNGYIKNYDKYNFADMNQPEITANSKIRFRIINRDIKTGNWGSAFFFKKKNWYDIPEDLKIIYGDNYVLRKNTENNKINYRIVGIPFNHLSSLSSGDPRFTKIILEDVSKSEKYIPDNQNKE